MIQRILELNYDKLIIGADLSALSYSYNNNIPIIWLRQNKPKKYLSNNLEKDRKKYENLIFLLSLSGNTPFGNCLSVIRIDNSELKLVTLEGLVIKITYNKLYIFDDYKIEGLPPPISKTSDENLVLDWFDVNSGSTHEFDEITIEDFFVNKIHFFISDRFIFGNTIKKDCCILSKINDSQLDEFEFSQTYCRLKVKKIMKAYGIKGRFDKTNNNFKPIILTAIKREIFTLGKNLYEDFNSKIEFIYDTFDVNNTTNNYIKLLEEKFGITF